MSNFVDFQDLKSRVSIETVLPLLGIAAKPHGPQLRACCPIHKGTDPRGFVVTSAKGLWYCFGGCGGGDMIALVAKVRGCEQKEAALFIAGGTGASSGNSTVPGNSNSSPKPKEERKRGFDTEAYAKLLDPEHMALLPLGIKPETYRAWKAGYATSGVHRGRLALPIAGKDGSIVAYMGRSVKDDESPVMTFPNGSSPTDFIFGADRVTTGEIYLVRDPLDVLRASENGIENVVSFLCEVTPQMLEMLSSLMDERRCPTVSLF